MITHSVSVHSNWSFVKDTTSTVLLLLRLFFSDFYLPPPSPPHFFPNTLIVYFVFAMHAAPAVLHFLGARPALAYIS